MYSGGVVRVAREAGGTPEVHGGVTDPRFAVDRGPLARTATIDSNHATRAGRLRYTEGARSPSTIPPSKRTAFAHLYIG